MFCFQCFKRARREERVKHTCFMHEKVAVLPGNKRTWSGVQ